MSFFPLSRSSLRVLGSTTRSTRGAQLPRPQQITLPSLVARSISQQLPSYSLNTPSHRNSSSVVPSPPPSSTPPSPTTANPPPSSQRMTFDFRFSSFDTPEAVAAALEVRQSIPPSDLALLTQDEQNQHNLALKILTRASRMDPDQRTVYFKDADLAHRPSDELKQSRRAKAKKQVESGLWDESDALTTEEWEEDIRVKRAENLKNGEETRMWVRDKVTKPRREREERLVVRREMKEAEEAETGSK